jgi:alcohol dehydrogenase (cytochrome c)
MKSKFVAIAGGLAVLGTIAAGMLHFYWGQTVPVIGMAKNYVRYLSAPAGTLVTELAPPSISSAIASPSPSFATSSPISSEGDWTSYNKSLTSDRYAPLAQINRNNVGRLKVLCVYDTGQHTGFNTGLLMVEGNLIFTTEDDIFSIDSATCRKNWRTHEDYEPVSPQAVNRGAAYMDGMLFRGTVDGRVLAYDFKTGKRVWQTLIANSKKGESVPAAPIAWNGLVFIGNAGGDVKGVKGRMYGLDAKSGKIVWEFYLVPKTAGDVTRGPQGASPLDSSTWKNKFGIPVTGGGTWTSYTLDTTTGLLYVPGGNPAPDFAPETRPGGNLYSGSVVVLDAKTGAYKNHLKIVPVDWHDWDVSNTPAILHTRGGRKILAVTPKDGHLYGFDLLDDKLLYRVPVTRMENVAATFSTNKAVHFCPGSTGGAEWNGPAYDPPHNLILIGEVDWCTTVTIQSDEQIRSTKAGRPWSGMASVNPYDTWGRPDPFGDWAGWVYAVDADSGTWKWRVRTNYPIQSGMTATAGGIAFFGDMGGNFYAVDVANGKKLWGTGLDGAIGGGVITYTANGLQKVAVAAGLTEILWPTRIATAKVAILGLDGSSTVQNRSRLAN